MEKRRMTSSDFNQSLLFLETIMASCANALSMTKKIFRIICSYSKTPRPVFGHYVMQNTKYSLKIKQTYLDGINGK